MKITDALRMVLFGRAGRSTELAKKRRKPVTAVHETECEKEEQAEEREMSV